MNVPIPPAFLYEIDLNRYEVMDGQQRLNAILEFYTNDFKLTGLDTWSPLNGLTYNMCPPRIQRGLDRRRISATVLLAESAKDDKQRDKIRRQVFERLNTGGQTLNAQELRNSLYKGTFNSLLIELAGNRLFDDIWGIPPYEDHYRDDGYISSELANNQLFRRMSDCEIVLRFLAFRRITNIKGSVRQILDNCMKDSVDITNDAVDTLRKRFLKNLKVAHKIFDEKTFQVKDYTGRWRHSKPMFDAVMVALDKLQAHHETLVTRREQIINLLNDALANYKTYDVIVGRPNTSAAIKQRIELVTSLMRQCCDA